MLEFHFPAKVIQNVGHRVVAEEIAIVGTAPEV
jgi:hypothetical protein